MTNRSEGLLGWQWSLYPLGHASRPNLVVHVVTVPLFMTGTVVAALGALSHLWLPLVGVAAMVVAVAAQGWGHKQEREAPVPFRGPLDVALRITAEQWITFPRFVLSGGLSRAWRAAGAR